MLASGALSAVDYPKASPLALACYKCVQGTAGGVGESSSVDCLTDVPEFRQVRHRRKSFARVPRRKTLGTVTYAGSRANSANNSATRGLSRGCSRTSRICGQVCLSTPLIDGGPFILAPST